MRCIRPILSALALAACAKTAPEAPAPAPAPAEAAPAPEPGPPVPNTATPAPADTFGDLTVQPLYHATLELDAGGKHWIVDPWSKAPLDDRKADVVLITDVHFDHLDKDAIAKVSKDGTVVVGPAAVGEQQHLDVTIANGETKDVAGVKVTAVPMYNLQRGPEPGKLFHDKGRGNGYVLEIGGKKVYIAGDTECTPEMKALTGIDVAFVPMNLPYTMPPEEAAQCIAAFKPKVVYPYHYAHSDLSKLAEQVGAGVDVRLGDWYPGGLPF
jgi:L-ascorbate metabolism protein UlaG (beta-lactamase superfamily)